MNGKRQLSLVLAKNPRLCSIQNWTSQIFVGQKLHKSISFLSLELFSSHQNNTVDDNSTCRAFITVVLSFSSPLALV